MGSGTNHSGRRCNRKFPAVVFVARCSLFGPSCVASCNCGKLLFLDVLCRAVTCCAVLQGVPAIALSLADHKATQAQHYAAPSEVAVTLIEVRGPLLLAACPGVFLPASAGMVLTASIMLGGLNWRVNSACCTHLASCMWHHKLPRGRHLPA